MSVSRHNRNHRNHRRTSSTLWVLVTLAVLVGPSALAHAGQSDNWGSHQFNRVAPNFDPIGTSDYAASNTGTHRVHVTGSTCPGPGNAMRIRVMHELPFFPDEIEGVRDFTCDVGSSQTYFSDDTGNFHLDIAKVSGNGTDIWSAIGHTNYP